MRVVLLFALLLLSMLCVARPARAQINRCLGAHGEQVYTDQPCGNQAVDGESVPAAATPGTLNAICPRSPQELRERVGGAFNGDDPNILSGLILWRGMDRAAANVQMRGFRRWLQRPLVGIHFSGDAAPPVPAQSTADPAGAASAGTTIGDDAGAPQPDDADGVPRHPQGLTVLTQSRDGEDDSDAPAARSFGVVDQGGCWWLTF